MDSFDPIFRMTSMETSHSFQYYGCAVNFNAIKGALMNFWLVDMSVATDLMHRQKALTMVYLEIFATLPP
jgi:hypothetical protein